MGDFRLKWLKNHLPLLEEKGLEENTIFLSIYFLIKCLST